METTDLMPLVDQLEGDIDELEEILEPLLKQGLSATTQKMTVMDKAKLHVLITYTIESLLFSYLRLQGVNAKEHPVFKELTRVKQYFTKIKDLETVSEKPTMTIDKQAVARFIKHGLAGNDKIDLERAEREAKERAMAQLRAAQMAKRQAAAAGTNPGTTSASQERLAEGETDDAENEVHMNTEVTGIEAAKPTESAPTVEETRKRKKGKKRKKTNQVSNGTQDLDRQEKKRMKKQKRQAGRAARAAENR